MLKITRVNLEKKLYTEGKNLDFYAMAITPWHLLGVKAFVKKLCSEKDTVRGILFIKFHLYMLHVAFLILLFLFLVLFLYLYLLHFF